MPVSCSRIRRRERAGAAPRFKVKGIVVLGAFRQLSIIGLLAGITCLSGCGSLLPQGEGSGSTAARHASAQAESRPLTGAEVIERLLPASLGDKRGWTSDIVAAFDAVNVPLSHENICAVLSEIAQESAFQAEPAVPGLNRIVQRELEARRKHYHIPKWIMNKSLAMQSPDGRSYNERIDALRTENDVNDLYQDMISQVPFGKTFLADYNPVHTGGPMQVNVDFANDYAANHVYPHRGSVRDALFTRSGGLYFGVAYLFDYTADYDRMRYRFADFNAGRYSSRNAAFQRAVSAISGIRLSPDGDLLLYRKGVARRTPSQTMQALQAIASRLKMDDASIYRDLTLEKTEAFERTRLYARVYALAPKMARAVVPGIEVRSVKFTRKLSTAAYASRVDARYRSCLRRANELKR